LFFVLSIWFAATSMREKILRSSALGLPFGGIVLLLGLYNFLRFGNPLENGYSYQVARAGVFFEHYDLPGNIAGPLFSPSYILTNFRYFAIALPDETAVATSVFFVSPFLIYLILGEKKWDLPNLLMAVNVVVVLIATLSFRSTGLHQMGYRFSLDYLPVVFWLLMRLQGGLSNGFKLLVVLAILIDVLLLGYFIQTRIALAS
jgi:hypothetical protein